MIFCGSCGGKKGWPMSGIRSGGDNPCDICGKVDQLVQVKPHPNPRLAAQGKTREVATVLGNFSYPSHLLPGAKNGRDAEAERERAGI